jgi:hypothetical protein
MGNDTEVVWIGGFMKDAGDIDPIPLVESAPDSFWWTPQTKLPKALSTSLDVLRKWLVSPAKFLSGDTMVGWVNRSAAAATLILAGIKRPTAFRHIKQLIQRGALRDGAGGITLAKTDGVWTTADVPKGASVEDFRSVNFSTPKQRTPTADEVHDAIRNLDTDREEEDPAA